MEYREFGQTGMRLSAVGLGGLLAHYWEGDSGHPPPEEKRRGSGARGRRAFTPHLATGYKR